MSFIELINQIDPDKFEKEARDDFLSRKDALRKMSSWSKKLALSAVPLGAIAAFVSPAKAQSRGVIDVLQYALTLELLESTFYTQAKNSGIYNSPPDVGSGVVSAHVKPTFDDIELNERQHVQFLQGVISANDAEPVSGLEFDFTAGGAINPGPFEDYATFLLVAQAFEDTGVRAYKGQAGFLLGTSALTPALQIHSVEARHASAVRRIRGSQGWIPNDKAPASLVAATYAGEANTTHAGLDVTTVSQVGTEAITEAWDEKLDADDVLAIVDPFIVNN